MPVLPRLARRSSDAAEASRRMSWSLVVLRDERDGRDSRYLDASIDEGGNLQLHGHDIGPRTSPMRDDGEYEWFETVAAADLARLVGLLGGAPGEEILDVLHRRYRGPASSEFTMKLYDSDIPVGHFSW
jgi:hypothetical protein